MNTKDLELLLANKGVRVTSSRMLVLSIIAEANHLVSQMEIEDLLQTVDRSTVSRAVGLFLEKGLIHIVDDGSGMMKYELCLSDHRQNDDEHLHFHCRECGRTYCFHDVPVPAVPLPAGFENEKSNFVLTGLCPDCSSRQ